MFVVRGENVVLLGEIEETEAVKQALREVSLEEILEKQAVQQAEKEETDRLRSVPGHRGLQARGGVKIIRKDDI